MRKRLIIAATLIAALVVPGQVAAQHTKAKMDMHGSKDSAVAMVKRGVSFIQENGARQGYAEISGADSRFKDGATYLVVYGLDGMVRAHGQNHKMVNKNLIALRDIDGKPYIKETVERARREDEFWTDHKFTNPMTRKVQPMRMYCERLDDSVICSGHFMH